MGASQSAVVQETPKEELIALRKAASAVVRSRTTNKARDPSSGELKKTGRFIIASKLVDWTIWESDLDLHKKVFLCRLILHFDSWWSGKYPDILCVTQAFERFMMDNHGSASIHFMSPRDMMALAIIAAIPFTKTKATINLLQSTTKIYLKEGEIRAIIEKTVLRPFMEAAKATVFAASSMKWTPYPSEAAKVGNSLQALNAIIFGDPIRARSRVRGGETIVSETSVSPVVHPKASSVNSFLACADRGMELARLCVDVQ